MMRSSYLSLKRLSLAVAFLAACTFWAQAAVDPVTVEVHYQNGVKYFKRGLYDRSVQEFEKTLSLDPGHPEAKAYLDKARAFDKRLHPVVPDAGKEDEARSLIEQGRSLYRQKDYEGARDAFNKALEIKRVDEFASYYREQCEIYIARKIAREKKAAARAQEKEKAREEKLRKKEALEEKRARKKNVLAKRAIIQEERQQAAQDRAGAAAPAIEEAMASVSAEKAMTGAQKKKQDKARRAEEKRREAQERREEKIMARDEKIMARDEKRARLRQEKAAAREARIVEKEQASSRKATRKLTEAEARQERQALKDLFIKGVEQYGKKDYNGAIAAFSELMEKERQSGLVYTTTARRLKAKAEQRLKGEGEDKEI